MSSASCLGTTGGICFGLRIVYVQMALSALSAGNADFPDNLWSWEAWGQILLVKSKTKVISLLFPCTLSLGFLPPLCNSLTIYLLSFCCCCVYRSLFCSPFTSFTRSISSWSLAFLSQLLHTQAVVLYILGSPNPPLLPFYFLHLSLVMSSSMLVIWVGCSTFDTVE